MAKFWKNALKVAGTALAGPSGILKALSSTLFGWIGRGAKKLGSSIADAVSSVASSDPVTNWVKGTTGSGLTNAQIQQNQVESQMAQDQRNWEEQMFNTKYQRQTADMQAAGLNPAMMYGQGYSASTPSGAAGSASDVGSPSGGLVDSILNVIFAKQRLSNLKAEGDVLKTKADEQAANAELAKSTKNRTDELVTYQRLINDWYPKLSQGTLDEIEKRLKKFDSDIDVNRSVVDLNGAKQQLTEAETAIKNLEKNWVDKIRAAQTEEAKANAVKAYADAAWQQYFKQYAEAHAGVTPGRDMWTGFTAVLAESISHVVNDVKVYVDSLIPDWLQKEKPSDNTGGR